MKKTIHINTISTNTKKMTALKAYLNSEKVKKVHDIWKFSKDSRSQNPNWLLIDTQA